MTQNLTILFDLDGTIVNTAPDLMSAHNHVMRKFGFEEKKMEDIKSLAGKGAWVMMQRSFKEEIRDEKTKKEMTKEFIDFYAKNGFAVIAPPSMARKKYAQSCDTATNKGGFYRSVLKIRQIDAENAILQAKKLSWTDNNNIFLVGLSEGGITTATYEPNNKESGVNGRVVEGWTCNAGWSEYRGLKTPYNDHVLSLVEKYETGFQ